MFKVFKEVTGKHFLALRLYSMAQAAFSAEIRYVYGRICKNAL